ncbi:beta-galactosidase [Coprobacter tertius]|uniref:Beta-galactosidase n=1 Tax=Coprobacter tertius TaxID=2944915 RepID=A0ABT1MJM6_9BACT|nr:beta-galactosidase [Coprobacter tertius]MCP9612830.1 beta-galactosidase [Coprobacter tertius]
MRKIIFLLLLFGIFQLNRAQESFTIQGHQFVLNGKPVQLICGEMHYSRIPHEYWRDRLKRAKAMGLNTISTYVFWNFHEKQPGVFDFKGQADLSEFLHIAQEEGLYVILRPGPYVCAEWDFGGYPWWLLEEKGMIYRSKDPKFMNACNRYIKRLGKEVSRQTITKGGNIIMVQVENEYGSYGNDKEYLADLRDMIKDAGFDVPLITCDGGGQLPNGQIDGTLATVNGVLGNDIFKIIDKYHPGGPYFVAEFYPAWFDVWGKPHSAVNYQKPAEQLDWMLSHNISVSMYMFHGGTNFWYTNGANTANGFEPQPTSYDYDAPLGEWGNITPKYIAFRKVIEKYLPEGEKLPDIPKNNPTTSFASITLDKSAPLNAIFKNTKISENILTMEDMGQDFGYIHYAITLNKTGKNELKLNELRDYAVIFLDGKQVGSADRRHNQNSVILEVKHVPARLEIIVENSGRINYGPDILHNRKGITHNVLWGDEELSGWEITSLPLYKENVSKLEYGKPIKGIPAFHKGTFFIEKIGDCFVDMSKWGKGAVWVNGHSLGKFWNIGPQQTLYLPAPWLKKGKNEIIVFALEDNGERSLQGLSQPILNQLGTDINLPVKKKEIYSQKPILDKGDIILSSSCNKTDNWQTFPFGSTKTLRHLCIEILSYQNAEDPFAHIAEIELIDENGNAIDKSKWSVVYADNQTDKGKAEYIYDNDLTTSWQADPGKKQVPLHIIIDTHEINKAKSIRIKTDEGKEGNGIKDFRIYGRPQFFLFE